MPYDHPVNALILAAGLGTRMKSSKAKVLHEVQAKPMILHVMDTVNELHLDHLYVIVGHQREKVAELITGYQADCIVQEEQLGTGHAVLCAEKELQHKGSTVLILSGDVPLIRAETLKAMLNSHLRSRPALTLMATTLADPTNYGRIVRNSHGGLLGIIEEKDATEDQKKIKEINAGIYCAEADFLFKALKKITTDNRQGEMYLTDIVKIAIDEGFRVDIFSGVSSDEVLGVNSKEELAAANSWLRNQKGRQSGNNEAAS